MKRILMIGTGGTIASQISGDALSPQLRPDALLALVPAISKLCEVECVSLFNVDSTSMTPAHWVQITKCVRDNYDKYDGFVISHGTDTMAYTAAALSYMIRGSKKPVILTGAQKPINFESTDSKVNLLDAFTCACYFPEVGNRPNKGDILSWAESSAVNYANSVLGARCNRNSGIIEMYGSILGFVPYFGLLTDEGRKASWIVEINTTKKPEAQLLGSAKAKKEMEEVPYIKGLDLWIGTELNDEACAYLKDFGAATASNGAVGLYHIDRLTPEAVEQGESLIKPDAKVYVIDDAELERVKASSPVIWKDKDATPRLCFMGCPHMT